MSAFIPLKSWSPPDSTPSASSADRADEPPFSTSPQRPPVFSAEPDLSAFVVEDYDPPPRPAPARPAPRAPAPSVPQSASFGSERPAEGGRGADSSSELTAAQQARKERIAAARAATFGDADEGHFDRQLDERSSDNGRAYGSQGTTVDRVSSGQVRSHATVRSSPVAAQTWTVKPQFPMTPMTPPPLCLCNTSRCLRSPPSVEQPRDACCMCAHSDVTIHLHAALTYRLLADADSQRPSPPAVVRGRQRPQRWQRSGRRRAAQRRRQRPRRALGGRKPAVARLRRRRVRSRPG